MLLSFERTMIAGAFAFAVVRAMLLHLIGLVQAVLPESKNMRKRTIRVSLFWDNQPHSDCLGANCILAPPWKSNIGNVESADG